MSYHERMIRLYEEAKDGYKHNWYHEEMKEWRPHTNRTFMAHFEYQKVEKPETIVDLEDKYIQIYYSHRDYDFKGEVGTIFRDGASAQRKLDGGIKEIAKLKETIEDMEGELLCRGRD